MKTLVKTKRTSTFNGMLFIAFALVSQVFISCEKDEENNNGEDPQENTLAITSFTPTSGREDDTLTLTGEGFAEYASQNEVLFTSAEATVYSASTTELIVIVPSGAQTGPLTVVVDGDTATSSTSFAFEESLQAPEITEIDPTTGLPGSMVTITGTNFSDDELSITPNVYFGDSVTVATSFKKLKENYQETGYWELTATVPNLPEGDVSVTVEVDGQVSNSVSYTVEAIPTGVKTVYWSANDGIYKGEIKETGASITQLYGANADLDGMVLDEENGVVYWYDANKGYLKGSITDSSETIISSVISELTYSTDMALDKENMVLYIGGAEDKPRQGIEGIGHIIKYDLQTSTYTIIFKDDNNYSFITGLKLSSDNSKLYYTQDYAGKVGVIDLSTNESANLYDFGNDIENGTINVMPANIAIDETNEKIYVVDKGNEAALSTGNRIFMGNLATTNGSLSDLTLIVDNDDIAPAESYGGVPYDIEIDTENGYIYWCVLSGSSGPLRRANLDGSNIEDLFTGIVYGKYFQLEIGTLE